MSGAAGLIALLLAQAPIVFDTGVEAVYVDVFVSEKSGPVLGLRAEDFVVEDNGVRQRVEIVDRGEAQTTALLALDVSASVAGQKLDRLRAGARAFLSRMQQRDEAALLTFGHRIELRHGPTTDRAAVAEALDRVVAGGGSAVIDTLYLCLKRRWGAGRLLVVLFTDGQDTGSWLENEDVLRAARGSSTLLFVVGTEAPSSRSARPPTPWGFRAVEAEPGFVYLLRRAAETTGGAYWTADPSRLEAVFLKVLEAANARYVLSYEPQGVPRPGRHRLEVSVRRRGVKVRARQEYVAPAVGEGGDDS
jgi:VWFA-related protein